MSTTVDQRVVEMRFDNKEFERNASTTMSTLAKLKQSLNLTGASKGLNDLNNTAKGINLSGLSAGVEAVSAKFSALQVVGVTALANITNSAVNAGKKIASALTIDPIKTGFSEYETQINAVQTILANTESKGTTLDDVNKALDTLNTYADKTIYNFTEMTRNIGTFTAAGVDLETSVSSIQGIANLAAVSGSTSQQASTAMYQLSQALAAGKVSLMDWNSVVNAGMGGQVFQDALKRTSEALGTGAEAAIEKYGSFRESLTQGEWLTTEVLTKTLEQFTMAAEEGSDEWKEFKKSLMADGYTEQQAEEILKMANTATNAATKVKTFTQLFDTLKEAAQSGWTQTWEILVGDFEEAKELLTNISNVVGGIIGESANARNELLQGWKDLGGRKDLIEGFKNIFVGLGNVAKPIAEAFREIFPALKPEQLVKVTDAFKDLTARFAEFTGSHGKEIKSIFKGIFSVLDVGWSIIKTVAGAVVKLIGSFSGVSGGVLGAAGALGGWLSKLSETINSTDIFGKSVEFVTDILVTLIDKIKELGGSAGKGLSKVADYIGDIFKSLDFSGLDFTKGFDLLNAGLFSGILLGVTKFTNNLSKPVKAFSDMLEKFGGDDGILGGLADTLDNVRGCFEAYQNQLQAGTLLKIASAIGILAAALVVISAIDAGALNRALGAISVLFVELMVALKAFTGLNPKSISGTAKSLTAMVGISTSILILAGALKVLSGIDTKDMIKGLGAIAILMAEVALFTGNAKVNKGIGKASASMILLATAMTIMAKAVKKFGKLDLKVIGKGLLAIGGSLLTVGLAMHAMPRNMVSMGVGLLAVSTSLGIMAKALGSFGGMKWTEIGKGLVAMGGSLAILAVGLHAMNGTLGGSTALLIAAGALAILTPVLHSLGNMSLAEIGKSLLVMAGAFTVLGVAGAVLGPLVPAILGLSGAIALFGAGCLAVGVGVAAFAAGLATLAVSGTAGVVALTAIIQGIIGLIPAAAVAIANGIVEVIKTIAESAGTIAESILSLITALLESFSTHLPKIVELGAKLVVGLLEGIATHLPEMVQAGADLIISFINSVATTLTNSGPQLVDAITNLLGAVVKTGIYVLTNGIPSFIEIGGNIVSGIITGIGNMLKSVVDSIINIGKSIVQGIKNFLGINSPSTVFISIGKDMIQGLINGVKSLATAAINAVKNIPSKAITAIKGYLSSFKSAASSLISNFITGVKNKINSAVSTIKTIPSKAITGIKGYLSSFKSTASSLITNFTTGIKNKLSGAVSAAKNVSYKCVDGIKGYLSKFKSAGSSLISNFTTGVKNKVSGAVSAAKTIPSNCVSAIKDYVSKFKSAGKDVVDGFINGLKSKISDAASWAGSLGSSVLNSAKRILGIASPSKEFFEIGKFSSEGLANGMVKFGGMVSKAASGVAESALETAQGSMSTLGDILGGKVDLSPTIRPVLDLDEVKSGANSISSMFNGGASVAVAANMAGINTAMNNRIQNGGNSDVVSAINRLGKDLGNMEGTTYNINGVTYDDGSNINSAVETIIRAARIERRV